jgi:hypothetical protein
MNLILINLNLFIIYKMTTEKKDDFGELSIE